MTQQSATAESATVPPTKVHLNFLDSIRGIAAFYVLAFHTTQQSDAFYVPIHAPIYVRATHFLFSHGHTAVDVFIVLSGFCLMMPVAKAGGLFSRGLLDFFKRRIRRIVPPYYATLVLSVVFGILQGRAIVRFHIPANIFSFSYYVEWIAVHLVLIHNLLTDFNYSFNSPLWTIATEWQIYFLFAFLLVPMFRKWGPWATIAIAYIAGAATYRSIDIREACLWYAGLFAMGMAAADICFSPTPKIKFSQTGLLVGGIVCSVLSCCSRYILSTDPGLDPGTDLFEGLSTACFIAYLTQASKKQEGSAQNRILQLLNVKPLVNMGVFSYSLYLVHAPFVMLTATYLAYSSFSLGVKYAIMYLVEIPIVVGFAYVFHLIFERPFMNSLPATIRMRTDSPQQDTAAVLPVP